MLSRIPFDSWIKSINNQNIVSDFVLFSEKTLPRKADFETCFFLNRLTCCTGTDSKNHKDQKFWNILCNQWLYFVYHQKDETFSYVMTPYTLYLAMLSFAPNSSFYILLHLFVHLPIFETLLSTSLPNTRHHKYMICFSFSSTFNLINQSRLSWPSLKI